MFSSRDPKTGGDIQNGRPAGKRRISFALLAAVALLTLCAACSKQPDDESDQTKGKTEAKEKKPFAQRIAEDREKGFEFSEDGTTLLKAPSSITEYDIPEGVTAIEKRAFVWNPSLECVTIPGSVTSIGEDAFSSCTSLKKITIPSSVTEIGAAAFKDCKSLERVTIPDSVTTIGEDAFKGAECEEQVRRDYPHLFE